MYASDHCEGEEIILFSLVTSFHLVIIAHCYIYNFIYNFVQHAKEGQQVEVIRHNLQKRKLRIRHSQ